MHEEEPQFSLKSLFIPFTTVKAIHYIILIGILVFTNGIFNSFVGDDTVQILENIFVHSINNIHYFFTGGTFYNAGSQTLIGVYYKPLLLTYYSLIYTVWGANNIAYHFFQIFLYITNACLLFFIFKKFFNQKIAFVLSLIFLVHPLNSEVAFYIADTQEVLFFFFGSIALLLIFHTQSKKGILFAILLLLCSLLSKESGILFYLISFIYLFLFNKKRLLVYTLLSFATLAIYFMLRINAIGLYTEPINSPITHLSFWERMINVPAIIQFYLLKFFYPVQLTFSYQWAYKTLDMAHFFLPLIFDLLFFGLLIILSILIKRRVSTKLFLSYIFFIMWFIIGLGLHVQFIPLDATVTERWFYFPMVGLLGVLAIIAQKYFNKLKFVWLITSLSVLIVLLAFLTLNRSFNWKDDYTLYNHDVQYSQDNYLILNGLGYELLKRNESRKALPYVQKSVAIFPYWNNLNLLGVIYLSLGDYDEAKRSYYKAIKYYDYYPMYENLAGLTMVTGEPEENIKELHTIINKYPQDAKIWMYLAILEYKNGNKQAAKEAITNANLYNYGHDAEIYSVYNSIIQNQELNLIYTNYKDK